MLNLSPAEAKVMDACNNDKWGPSGTVMHEICDYTRYAAECEDVLNILFMKLEETGRNWRQCYKALSCIEFMVRCPRAQPPPLPFRGRHRFPGARGRRAADAHRPPPDRRSATAPSAA